MEKELKFEELEISENLKRALADAGYEKTTPIQMKAIPEILNGKDIIGLSQTGTGKTAAYGLPVIEKIEKEEKYVQTIILCPTRELAIQVTEELRKFTKYEENVKCVAIYGGDSIERQIRELKRGAKIVVGTPGRVMDHIRRKTLKLNNVKMVVLDEADEMLNMGFEEDIKTILNDVPEERQTVLFSATMNKKIMSIAEKYLNNPIKIRIKTQELTVDKIEQIGIQLKQPMKDETVMRLIEVNNPNKVVIFCNTKKKVDDLIENLKKNGYKAESLHGDIKQAQRQRIMNRFKAGEFKILVATDVVARGIDVDNLDLVINYDIPQDEEYYVHRIGRTGRNGAFGRAYTFVMGKEMNKINSIEKYANTKILFGKIPTVKQIEEIKNKKTIQKIQDVIDKKEYNNNETNNEIIKGLLETNEIEDIAKALLEIINSKKRVEKTDKISINIKNSTAKEQKLFITLGKKDNIKPKDIVGSITANTAISGDEIGKINILDKFSFIEVPTDFVEEIMNGMQGKKIKGKEFNIEIANS